MPTRKKVLIIAYLFPPTGGGGVQRALKMAKYLGQFDWDVHVLTVEPNDRITPDPSLLAQIPDDVTIHRSQEINLWNRRARTAEPSSTINATQPSRLGALKKRIISILKKIKNTINVPDDQILWYPYAKRLGLQVMNEQHIDVILSTSGPYTNHLVGNYLKRQTGKTWIADFRDPWTQNMHRPTARWRQWLEDAMEARVIRESDCLLTVTQSFANNFREKYGNQIKQLEVIHNGFDRADYVQINNADNLSAQPREKWHLVYTGIFYKERNPRLLLEAVAELIREGTIPKDQIKLQFAGVFDYPGNNENVNCVKKLGLEHAVEILGHLPHQQALQTLAKADVLMLISDTHPQSGDYIPGKLYEYMAIGHPILALSMPGESTRIIEENNLGEIAHPTSLAQIKQALVKLYDQWKNEETSAKPPLVAPLIYERKEQARMLAELMTEIITPKPF